MHTLLCVGEKVDSYPDKYEVITCRSPLLTSLMMSYVI